MPKKQLTIKLTKREAKAVIDFFDSHALSFCESRPKTTADATRRAYNKLVATYRRDINGH